MDTSPLLTSEDLIFLNDHLISGYGGGVSGVRYLSGLESAANRPFITLFGEEQYVSCEAKDAALYELLTGAEPIVGADEAVRVCLGVEDRRTSFETLRDWLFALHEGGPA